jgi:hypothetical protein
VAWPQRTEAARNSIDETLCKSLSEGGGVTVVKAGRLFLSSLSARLCCATGCNFPSALRFVGLSAVAADANRMVFHVAVPFLRLWEVCVS